MDNDNIARVVSEHRERYVVRTRKGDFEGEIMGNLRFTATSRADFPAVGDWVDIMEYDEDKVLIQSIHPRSSVLERQAVGNQGDRQIIAVNVDCALIVQAVDRDFNLNRVERYLALCLQAKIEPVVVLNKIDLIEKDVLVALLESVKKRSPGVRALAISNETEAGYEELLALIEEEKTYCLLGSSGVGKSTLTNKLTGQNPMQTDEISSSTGKGRHVTSHRELFSISNGAFLIDNPGMREVGIADAGEGLEATFEDITEAALHCKFKDCTHTSEKNCAVLEGLESGDIDPESYENYLKMEREKDHFEATAMEKRQKDKDFGKMIRNVKKDLNSLSDKRKGSYGK